MNAGVTRGAFKRRAMVVVVVVKSASTSRSEGYLSTSVAQRIGVPCARLAQDLGASVVGGALGYHSCYGRGDLRPGCSDLGRRKRKLGAQKAAKMQTDLLKARNTAGTLKDSKIHWTILKQL